MSEKKPFDIARETLKQLTHRKLPPTPVNYKAIYHEIAGLPMVDLFPTFEMRSIAAALPIRTPGQQRQKALLESAVERMNWDAARAALVAYGSYVPTTPEAADSLQRSQGSGASLASVALAPKGGPEAARAPGNAETGAAALTATVAAAAGVTRDFLVQLAHVVDYALPALGEDDERFAALAQELLAALRLADVDMVLVKQKLAAFSHRLSFVAEEQAEIRKGLLNLLQAVFDNVGDIWGDDRWLRGQMDALRGVCSPPLSLRRLDDVERRLREVVARQKQARQKSLEAQEDMRRMLAVFIERLSEMALSTGTFHTQLEESAALIQDARSLEEIAPVLENMVAAARTMALESQTARDELNAMREQASRTQLEIAKLHEELDRVSVQARHDPLTGALNRKGLDEALEREISTLQRKETPLCVALLDIDNFKHVNDALGHVQGDQALAHLAVVARESLRPQDSLARYGGEEFVILLPDTTVDKGVEVLTRLQRELSKRLFLSGKEKVLITFSAGVAQMGPDETGLDAIHRADEAMYLAKRAGKNRVVCA